MEKMSNIITSMSIKSWVIWIMRFQRRGWEEDSPPGVNRLKQRIEHLDKIHPPKRVRKDRVTTVSFEIPTPDNLKPEDESKFFSIAYSEIARTCGGMKNVTNGYVHNDETRSILTLSKRSLWLVGRTCTCRALHGRTTSESMGKFHDQGANHWAE